MKANTIHIAADPVREALAEAIEARRIAEHEAEEAGAALDAFDAKLDVTRSAYFDAEKAVDDARAAAEEALRQHGGNLDAIAVWSLRSGMEHTPAEAMAIAVKRLADLEQPYRLGREGRHKVAAAKTIKDENVARAVEHVIAAATAVELTALPKLIDEAEKVEADYDRRVRVLAYLAWEIPSHERPPSLQALLRRGYQEQAGAALAPWAAARTALLQDPNAEIPA